MLFGPSDGFPGGGGGSMSNKGQNHSRGLWAQTLSKVLKGAGEPDELRLQRGATPLPAQPSPCQPRTRPVGFDGAPSSGATGLSRSPFAHTITSWTDWGLGWTWRPVGDGQSGRGATREQLWSRSPTAALSLGGGGGSFKTARKGRAKMMAKPA